MLYIDSLAHFVTSKRKIYMTRKKPPVGRRAQKPFGHKGDSAGRTDGRTDGRSDGVKGVRFIRVKKALKSW